MKNEVKTKYEIKNKPYLVMSKKVILVRKLNIIMDCMI